MGDPGRMKFIFYFLNKINRINLFIIIKKKLFLLYVDKIFFLNEYKIINNRNNQCNDKILSSSSSSIPPSSISIGIYG